MPIRFDAGLFRVQSNNWDEPYWRRPPRRGLVSFGSELALGIWNGPCPCLFVYIIISELRSVNRRACLLVHWDEKESVSLPTDDSASSDLPVVADEVCGLQVPTSMRWDELIEVLHFSLRSPQEGMPIPIPSGVGVTYNLSGIIDRVSLTKTATRIAQVHHASVWVKKGSRLHVPAQGRGGV